MRARRTIGLFLLASALVLPLGLATAARADALLGEPWERDILDGIDRQERERTQRSADALLRQARLQAARRSDGVTTVVRLYLLGRAYGIAGDPGSARSTYRDVLQRAPRCYFVYHDLAMLALGQTPPDLRAGEQYLRQSIQINPGFTTGHRKLALAQAKQGRHAEAVQSFRRVIEQDPKDTQARVYLCQSLFEANLFDECLRELAILRRADPRQPALRALEGDVYRRMGKLDQALAVFRALAVDNPSQPEPLGQYLSVLDEKRRVTGTVDVDETLWALEGLYRIERDPKRREELKRGIEEIRTYEARLAAPRDPTQPPSDEELVAVLAAPQGEARIAALRYVYARPEAPAADVMRAAAGRLSPLAEPEAKARAWALRVLGRFGHARLVGLVRHSLKDPAAEVALLAVDTLTELGRAGGAARREAVLALGLATDARDDPLAGAARAALAELVQARYPEPAEDTEAARRVAFRAWWTGPVGSEVKTDALEQVLDAEDPAPEDLIVAYLPDADVHVLGAAWRALEAQAGRARGPRAAWLGRLPSYDAAALEASALPETRRRLEAWAASMPR